MYHVVIAEKPSVAQSLAVVIGADQRKDGYLEGNGWRVSWCLGHLMGLADAECYDPKFAKWRYDDLPILPDHWQTAVNMNKQKQFDVLRRLMNTPDVDEIINACDAGREGELIFRNVYQWTGCQKPVKRLWISSMEDAAIRNGFENLRPGCEYDGLYQTALCRAKADWLVGINATRLFSVLYHRTLHIGRVMTPTLALVVHREAEITAFKPQPFYTVTLELPGFTADSGRIKDKSDAELLCKACQNAKATVKQVEHQEKTDNPPRLYDLTTLQRDANRILGFTAQQTLTYLQSLYEKKLCTYPRSDSRYLPSDMAEGLPELVKSTAASIPFFRHMKITCNTEYVINDKKVSDHHAIIPTRQIATIDQQSLPSGERAILELIALRLCCAVGPSHVYTETIAAIECAGQEFAAKGKIILVPGWRELDSDYRTELRKTEDNILPDLQNRQIFAVSGAAVRKRQTSPPKHFTEDTLLAAMETAGAEDIPKDSERKGLGTPATRAGILEKLISDGFLERKKSGKSVHLLPSHSAAALITVLPEQLQSPLLTAEWEAKLNDIARNKLKPEDFLTGISDMLRRLVDTYQVIQGTEFQVSIPREIVGRCPRCGSEVAEMPKGFFCNNTSCNFAIWKNSKWWSSKKKKPTKAIVTVLLRDGRAKLTDCYSEKTGKTYDATVVLDDTGGNYVGFKLEFDAAGPKRR